MNENVFYNVEQNKQVKENKFSYHFAATDYHYFPSRFSHFFEKK